MFFICIVLPTMSILSGKLSDEAISFLPPKKHLFYSNGLMLIIGGLLVLSSWNIGEKDWSILGINLPVINDSVMFYSGILILAYLIDTGYSFYKSVNSNEEIEDISAIIPLNWTEYKHFIFLALAAGICEEIVFRGFLINYLMQVFSFLPYIEWVAVLLPAIIFSISHAYQGYWAVLKIFGLALLFGLIYVHSKSLLLVIIIHVCIDLFSGLMAIIVRNSKAKLS
jgi:membrane protease YdiL (CAAX protease family)